MSEFLLGGVLFFVHYNGKYLYFKVGNFERGKTSHLFYKFITVVSTRLLYHMYGRRFIL